MFAEESLTILRIRLSKNSDRWKQERYALRRQAGGMPFSRSFHHARMLIFAGAAKV